MADYSGFGALGAALAGGGQPTGAFQDQLLRNYRAQAAGYDVERAREQAGIERLQRIAREGLGGQVAAVYGQNPTGDLVAGLLGANGSPSLSQAGPLADLALPGAMELRTGAVDALQGGDYALYNALNAGLQGKPFEPVRDLGDVLVSSGAPLGAGMVVPPKAQADIDLTRARIETEAARQDRLERPGASRGGSAPNYTVPTASTLESALTFTDSNGKVVPDYADRDAFLIWQAQQAQTDPRYNDGDFALGQWLATREQRDRAELEAAQLKAAARAERKGAPVMVDPANLGDALIGPAAAAPVSADPASDLIAQANDAIARGANPALVEKRLREKMAELGLDPRN